MSTELEPIEKVPKLAIPRPTHTCQGFVLYKVNGGPPWIAIVNDRGGNGKYEGLAIPGGSREHKINVVINGVRYENLIERDLYDILDPLRARSVHLLELNGEPVDNPNKELNYLLHQYEFGSVLELKVGFVDYNPGDDLTTLNEKTVTLEKTITLELVGQETLVEAMIREFEAETGFAIEVLMADLTYDVKLNRWEETESGELFFETHRDQYTDRENAHYVHVFHLNITGFDQNKNREIEEVGEVSRIAVDKAIKEIYTMYPASEGSGNRYYFKHGRRILLALSILDIPIVSYLPKYFRRGLSKDYLDFLPGRISRAYSLGVHDFNGVLLDNGEINKAKLDELIRAKEEEKRAEEARKSLEVASADAAAISVPPPQSPPVAVAKTIDPEAEVMTGWTEESAAKWEDLKKGLGIR